MTLSDNSFSTVFSHALRGEPCIVSGLGAEDVPLPVRDWTREADVDDLAMLALCTGPTVDVGCGPGRLTAALAQVGRIVLGIDVVPEAVGQTLRRGGSALHRDVFDPIPGEGRWESALLADGNVGIGGDPEALLRRVRELVTPLGRIVVEVAPPGVADQRVWATIECDGTRSRPFRWAVVGMDGIHALAASAGLSVQGTHRLGERWCAVLEERM
ncbi:methyltransferase domain-containing protein [Nocardioides lianchengensis]|uniref:Methyltransferase domain-containing protein n=1 Tax=Nocardioides lianchengensis TaxID=1045774 RepID=A0A1G6XEA9_9ACTN|nr:methyltransferase domain-containing protein [Nocardioides lianchengensis]NYG09020.1 SAM-dependent methyltransferase [Nocardioides lianchengensis]SDD75635.1 Methyltransferase domain-containing protein [Nocardioides lianchengensis]